MFIDIKKNDSLFLINDTVIDRFNAIRNELELITLMIPPHLDRFQTWNLLLDFWIKFAFPEDKLIEHPHHSLIYIVRKTLLHETCKLQEIQRVLPLTNKNDRFAYLLSLYTLLELNEFFLTIIRRDAEYACCINDVAAYASKDIASYFDESFQTLESYPKQLATIQAKAFRKITDAMASCRQEVTFAAERAIKKAKDMYYLLYDAFI